MHLFLEPKMLESYIPAVYIADGKNTDALKYLKM